MVSNKAFVYKSIPHGLPKIGQDIAIESTEFDPSQAPPKSGITTKNYYASFDPAQRGRMRDPKIPSYSPAMTTGTAVGSVSIIAKVLKSDVSRLKEGAWVIGSLPTEEYSVVSEQAAKGVQPVSNPKALPLEMFLGPMGMTGLTAWGSLQEIGNPKKGETIFVSAASGAVGQMVGQFAAKQGLTVIGSVGDDAKVDLITKELGFAGGFNYKKEKTSDALKRLAPDGIDIFYDNVGGETLDAAMAALKLKGRIIASGAVSQYNNKPGEGYGVKNTAMMVVKRLRWEGFLVFDENITQHIQERNEKVTEWILDGSLKSKFHFTEGIDKAAEGFVEMLQGKNVGKAILKIADPEEK